MTNKYFPLGFARKTGERCGQLKEMAMGVEFLIGIAVLVVAIGSRIVVKNNSITINIGNKRK